MTDLIAILRATVGEAHVLLAPDDVRPYATDWRGRYTGLPLCVVRPGTTEQVASVVSACAAASVSMVPQGGNTGLCGGATPIGGEVVINLMRMNRIRAVDAQNNSLTAEAGCTLHAVQQAATVAGRLFPLSLAAEGSASIGGNLSTNAGGVQVLRYGNTRDLTLGLEVVLADGRIWNGLRSLRKDNTGYDLKHLFIGAEGSLGLITAATVKLYPQPKQQLTAWVALRDPECAVALLARLRAAVGDHVTAFEVVGKTALDLVIKHIPNMRAPLNETSDWQLLLELSSFGVDFDDTLTQTLSDATVAGEVISATIANNEYQAKMLWALRENISEAQRIEGISIKHDISVAVSAIPEFIRRAGDALHAKYQGLRIVCFGHIGDGNLHYNLSKLDNLSNGDFIAQAEGATRVVHDLVHALNGSISAEHGIGQLKREELRRYKSETELEMMRSIKRALDPQGLMNPGKVL